MEEGLETVVITSR